MNEARIFAAASRGTKSHSASPQQVRRYWERDDPPSHRCHRRTSARTRTSSISGTLVRRHRSPVRVAAAMSFRAAFARALSFVGITELEWGGAYL